MKIIILLTILKNIIYKIKMVNNFDNITLTNNNNYFNLKILNSDFSHNTAFNNLLKFYKNELLNTFQLFHSNININILNNYINFYLDIYYKNLYIFNTHYINYSILNTYNRLFFINIISYLNSFFKILLFLIIIYSIFFITNIYNYIHQLTQNNYLAKFFILNESEKEIGPVDDLIFFVVLFILTIFSFIFASFFYLILQGKFFIWAFSALILIMILILSIPVNLFIDYGFYFFVYVRGSASGGNFIKELLFDLISTFTIFIRFIIQNIRFLFIFSAIFELLEWIFTINSNIFFMFNTENKNFLINLSNINYIFNNSNYNIIIINLFMFVILYFYYTLHLLFLLLVQIVIYIGISSWLFFFLYSTKFLNKHEKFFLYKKYL